MSHSPPIPPAWSAIDTVCLDLDGTLLDQAYDNHIWQRLVPQRYAASRAIDFDTAYEQVATFYEQRKGTLEGYCLDHWTRAFGVDLRALHCEERARVAWLAGAQDFLRRVRAQGKRLLLLTNSHPDSLAIKHECTGVLEFFDGAVSSQELGAPKEDRRFWGAAIARFGFDPARSLFADDNAHMLHAAHAAGMRWIYGVRISDTRRAPLEHHDFPSVAYVADLG